MKKNLFLLLVALLAFVLIGCNNEEKPSSNNNKRTIPGWEEGKSNVVYYTWGSENENKIFQEVIDEFEKENPDIHVIIQKAGNDYYGDLELQLAGRQSPDIVQMKPGYIQTYLKSGAIISLQDYINNSKLIKDDMIWDFNDGYRYNKDTQEIGNHSDDIYCLIKDFSCDFVMNYNKLLVTDTVAQGSYPKEEGTKYPSLSVPMTYSQYIDFANAMQGGSTMGTALDNEPYQQLLEWIEQAGGSLYSEDNKKVNDIKTDKALRQAFDYYRMLRDECTKNPVFDSNSSAFTQNKTALAVSKQSSVQVGPGQLKQRQAGSIFFGRWAYTTYQTDVEGACETGFAHPPVPNDLVIEENTKYAGITAMVGMAISAKSNNKDAAFKFIEYYFTKGQESLAKQGFNIPGNKKVAETTFLNSDEISEKDRATNEFFYNLANKHGFVIKYNKYMNQSVVEKVLSAQLSQYFANSKGKDFDMKLWESTLDKITQELQKQLDRYAK